MKTKFMRGLAIFLCLSMILGFVPGSFLHVHAEEIAPDVSVDAPADGTTENEAQHPAEGTLIANGNFESPKTDFAGAWKALCGGYGNASVVYDEAIASNVLKVTDPHGSSDEVRSATELEGAKFPVAAGQIYDLSLKVKQDAAYADKAVGSVTLYIFWIDANGNFLDADGDGTLKDPEYYFSTKLPMNADWTDVNASVQIPAGAVSAYLRFNTFVGDINCYYVDDISFTRNPTLLTEGFNGHPTNNGWTVSNKTGVMNYDHAVSGKSIIFQKYNPMSWALTPAIAAVPGFTYTAKFMHSKTSYDGGATYSVGTGGRASIYFVDENGATLEETVITIGEQDGWEEATLSARAPANTVSVYVKFFVDAAYTGDPCFSLDNFVLTETEGEVLQPVERPMVSNGDFEAAGANWKNVQAIEGAGRDGSIALLVDSVNRQKDVETTAAIPVAAGTTYTVSLWAKRAPADQTNHGVTVYAFYKDAAGNFLDADGDGTLKDPEYYTSFKATPAAITEDNPDPDWEYVEHTFTAPAGTATVMIRFYGSSSFGGAMYIDDVKMVKTAVPTNGDFSNGTTGWKGNLTVNEEGQAVVPIFAPSETNGKRSGGYLASTSFYPAAPGETFKLTVDAIRTANEARTGKDSGASYIGFWYYDADGTCINAQAINPTADEWTSYEMLWTAPEGTASFKIEFGVNSNSGASFLFDNIKVVNVADIPPVVVAPSYPKLEENFDAYTTTYAGWTGDYTVTTEGMKLNGSVVAAIPYIAGATYAAEATGAEAAIVDGQLVLTAENAIVSDYAVYLLCADTDDHNCDYCGVKLSDCVYDNDCDNMCDICYETRIAPHAELTHFEAKEAIDCANPGNIEYWACSACGETFSDAEAQEPLNPWFIEITVECVRPEGIPDCATVTCETCGNEIYGPGEHDVLACQGGTCTKCEAEIEGFGCVNNDTPACEDGTCSYCGGFVAGFGHENGAWAPCCDGECSYGCGLQYPATEDHVDEDADDYCDNCWNHLNHSFDNGFDPCYGGECSICWTYVPGAHAWVDGACSVCGEACDHNGLEEGTCEICGKELVVDLTGTEQAPVQLRTPTSNVTISKAPYYYQGYFSGMNLVVIGTGDFSVIYNGNTFAAVDGVANVGTVSSSNPRMPVVFAIDGIGDFAIEFSFPVGHMDNPAAAVLGDNAANVAAGSQGYYFNYIAEKDGELVITISGADSWMYVVNNLTSYRYGDTQWSDSDPVVNPTIIEVAAGDEIQIMVNGYDPANPWSAPAAELNVNLAYAPEAPAVDENLKFYNVAMNLGADISGVFQFMYNTADTKYVAYKVVADGVELKIGATATSGTYVLNGYMLPKAAKEMADVVDVTVYGITADGTEVAGETRTWSIKQGAFELLDANAQKTDDQAKKAMDLIANMLAYGAAAQRYFGYNLDNLATDGLKAEYAALIKTTAPEMNTIAAVDQTGAKVKFAQVSFNLAERIQVIPMAVLAAGEVKDDYKAVITQTHKEADGTVSTKEYTINGADCLQQNTVLGVYIDEMASDELRDEMTITLYKGEEAVSAAYKFSPESVLKGMLESKTELITAIMNYGDAAIAYFA